MNFCIATKLDIISGLTMSNSQFARPITLAPLWVEQPYPKCARQKVKNLTLPQKHAYQKHQPTAQLLCPLHSSLNAPALALLRSWRILQLLWKHQKTHLISSRDSYSNQLSRRTTMMPPKLVFCPSHPI
jgi:hypothetical protein